MMRKSKGCQSLSPPLGDEDHTYFTYRPLSNLPTPPPSSRNSSSTTPVDTLADGEPLKPKYLGPAIHLVNLVPASASLASPSVPLVQAILTRAGLPVDTIALAVCILDSLDSKKFARRWRSTCPLIEVPSPPASLSAPTPIPIPPPALPYFLSPSPSASPRYNSRTTSQTHIDSVRPEVIILSALVIAVKFLEDSQDPTEYYSRAWAADTWSNAQLNTTERCIMEELDYRIMPLYNEDLLTDAMVDMQLVGRAEECGRTGGGCGGGGGCWLVSRDLSPPESLPTQCEDYGENYLEEGELCAIDASSPDYSATGNDGLVVGLGLHMEFD